MTEQIALGLIGLGAPALAALAAMVVAVVQFRGQKVPAAHASEPAVDLSQRLIDELTADRDDYRSRLEIMTLDRDRWKSLYEALIERR